MSASTMSVTAAAARRRPVVAGDKKSNLELFPNEGGDRDRPNGIDLNYQSTHAEAVLERSSRELAPVRKAVAPVDLNNNNNNSAPPRRTRKATAKPEQLRAKTVARIIFKNLVALMVLAGLVQVVRWYYFNSVDDSRVLRTPIGFSEMEGRISEVEGLLKTTAKMIQLQVDVVERKIESEIGGLSREMHKIDDKTTAYGDGLKKLESKLESSLEELKAAYLPTKEEISKMYEELKKGKSGPFGDNEVTLHDLRVYARDIVEKEIEKHAADGLGRMDFALADGGAMVVSHSDPYVAGKVKWFARSSVHPNANKMLSPSFGQPGQCFALKGSSGFVQINLRRPIVPEAVTLEHVDKSVAYDRSSAPKDCRISGWLRGINIDTPFVDDEKMFLMTEFTYDLDKSNAQTFNMLDSAASLVVDTIRLDFTSNHGSSSHTCVYRLRVHGHEPDSVPLMELES